MKFKSNSIYLFLGLSVLLALASAFITYYNTREKEELVQTVIKRYKSVNASENLLSLIKDMETGQRGYLITGDSDFLEPYDEAKIKITAATDTLYKLAYDNEDQANLVTGQIVEAIEKKTNDLESVINLANSHGRDSAAVRVGTKIGKAHMDTIRILVQDFIQREKILLELQNEKLERNTRVEDDVRFSAFALIAITSLAAILRLLKKRRNINELVKNLENANVTLENKVEERTKDLVAANSAKDHFLSIASHDLKAPIVGILGLIRLMKTDQSGRSETDREYLAYMEESCHNMYHLIANLLDINRIELGENTIKKQSVNLPNLLNQIKSEFEPQAQRKQIKLSIIQTDGTLHTDPNALQRILENLLSNAIKFSPKDTTVCLRLTRASGQVQFEVIDEGPGIPQEEIKELFNKFSRLSNKPTGGEESSGLGLSIVKELVGLIDGNISVESTLHKGSVFSVTLYHQEHQSEESINKI